VLSSCVLVPEFVYNNETVNFTYLNKWKSHKHCLTQGETVHNEMNGNVAAFDE